mgnify:CR=1 FL=1
MLCLAGLLAATGAALGAAPTASEVFARAGQAVSALEVTRESPAGAVPASALALGGGQYATTCDALGGHREIVLVAGRDRAKVKLLAQDAARNLCLLESAALPGRRADRRETQPTVGERVYALTNSLGLGIGISEGIVSGVRKLGKDEYIQFTAPIAPGSEGGGLFDGEGRLLGVIDYRWRDGQNVNFAAPAAWLDEIASRDGEGRKRVQFRDRALELARQEKVKELLASVGEWTQAYPEDAEAWTWLGAAREAADDPGGAEKAYREVRRLDAQSVRGGLGLARSLMRQKRWTEARDLARGLLDIRKEDADIWVSIAYAELSLNNLKEAEEAYRKATALAPYFEGGYFGLAELARRRGDLDTQEMVWRRLSAMPPERPQFRLALADVYLMRGDTGRAYNIVEEILQAHPENADAWYHKGKVLFRLGRPLAAVEALRKGVELKPKNPGPIWAAMGTVYAELRMWPEAVAAYRACVAAVPGESEWQGNLGVVLKDAGQFEEARKIFLELTEKHPADAFGWRQLGFTHALQGHLAESAKALENSLNIDPKQAKTWLALMEVYHQQGRPEDLRRAYQQLRGVDQEYAERAYKFLIVPLEVAP